MTKVVAAIHTRPAGFRSRQYRAGQPPAGFKSREFRAGQPPAGFQSRQFRAESSRPAWRSSRPRRGLPGEVSKEVSWATMRVDLPAVSRSASVVYSSSALRLAALGSKRSHGEGNHSMFSFVFGGPLSLHP